MSEEQINIAIAEECGIISRDQWGLLYRTLHGIVRNCPDYCNDLNAMHETLKLLSQQCKDSDFWFFLRKIIGFPDAESDWDESFYFEAINATARQRAEAFLRTLGKWEEEK
jgi:hypothetical protein